MSRKLVPVVGGRIERFCAVYVIAPVGKQSPVAIGQAEDPLRRLSTMQSDNFHEIELRHHRFTVDAKVASRVVSLCHARLREHGRHRRGVWFDMGADEALSALESAAAVCGIVLMTPESYLSICRPEREIRAEKTARRLGLRLLS